MKYEYNIIFIYMYVHVNMHRYEVWQNDRTATAVTVDRVRQCTV